MTSFPKTDQEERLEDMYKELASDFKEMDKTNNNAKQEIILKNINGKIKDAKNLIKEYEREARADGVPPAQLKERKDALVDDLNTFISLKKTYTNNLAARNALFVNKPGATGESEGISSKTNISTDTSNLQTTQQVISAGRKDMADIDKRLVNAERILEDTVQIGTTTAAELKEQTKQMEKIVEDLDNIEFTLEKARKVITDLTRGLLTDKFIRFLLFLVVIAIVTAIAVKIFDNDEDNIPQPREVSIRKLLNK